MKQYIAIFDLDHTILDTSSGKLITEDLYNKGLIDRYQLIYGFILSTLYKTRIINAEKLIKKWVMKLKGQNQNEIKEYAQIFFDKIIKKHIRKSAFEEIQYHKNNNAKLIMLSASLDFICEPFKNYYFDDIICTRLETKNNKYTGNIIGKYCYGINKLYYLNRYVEQNKISLKNSYYYADSYEDIYVFKNVDNPVCINPGKKLKRVALKNGWKILYW